MELPPSPPIDAPAWPTVQAWPATGREALWPAHFWTGMGASVAAHAVIVLAVVVGGPLALTVFFPPPHGRSTPASSPAIELVASPDRPPSEAAPPDEAPPVTIIPPPPSASVALAEPELRKRETARGGRVFVDTAAATVWVSGPQDEIEQTPAASGRAAHAVASNASNTPTPTQPPSPPRQTVAAPPPSLNSRAALASIAQAGAETKAPRRPTFSPEPIYPPEALAARQAGRVVLRVRITSAGLVAAVTVYRGSGIAALDDAALAAVRRWRFEPRPAGPDTEFAVPILFEIQDPQ